jgi:hypothetical protein
MRNDDEQPLNLTPTPLNPSQHNQSLVKRRQVLYHWIHQLIRQSQAHHSLSIKLRQRGNTLHILCEDTSVPDVDALLAPLQQALGPTVAGEPLSAFAALDPPIYRLVMYGRAMGQVEPAWSRAIRVATGAIASEPTIYPTAEAVSEAAPEPVLASLPTTLQSEARHGHPQAIARYLSDALGNGDVSIRAKLDRSHSATAPSSGAALRRLLILCESAYVPDVNLLAEPIAQQVRSLALEGFRDAVVFGQVSGEPRPEWVVRIDLTPATAILQDWGRWGDVQAIAQLIRRHWQRGDGHGQLDNAALLLTDATLKEATLHLSCGCHGQEVPPQTATVAQLAPLLEGLAPQGIQAAAIYGLAATATADTATPAWVHWLDLPAKTQPALAATPFDLAQQGDLAALTFLLTRLLNPNLDTKLATGGVRVQVRLKGDVLHLMTEAPNCPRRDWVVPELLRCLKPMAPAGVAGVRIYGRASGQKQPLWNYGSNFASPAHPLPHDSTSALAGDRGLHDQGMGDRLVPAAIPEFAASDAHVEDLLEPAGAMVLWQDATAEAQPASGLGQVWRWVQRSLIHTQLFIPADAPLSAESYTAPLSSQAKVGTGLVWAAVGIVMVLGCDWMLGQWLRVSTPDTATAGSVRLNPQAGAVNTRETPFPDAKLNQPKVHDWQNPDATGFTQPGKTDVAIAGANSTPLSASPLRPKFDGFQPADYPTFNSRQLDVQIAAYRNYVAQYGAPDVLVVGSSRALRGIDPMGLQTALSEQGYPGVRVFNFGINGATAQVAQWLVQDLLPADKLPKLVLMADGARAFNSGRLDITYRGIVASAGNRKVASGQLPIPSSVAQTPQKDQPRDRSGDDPGFLASRYEEANAALTERLAQFSLLYGERDRLRSELLSHASAWLPSGLNSAEVIATSDSLLNSSSPAASASTGAAMLAADGQGAIDVDGFLPLAVQFNPVTYYQAYARVPGDYDSDYENFNLQGEQTDALIQLSQFLRQRQIPLVFVNLPLTREYLDLPRKQAEAQFQQTLVQVAPQAGLVYRDLSNALLTQPHYFSDPSHLNRYGAYEVSRRLAQDAMIPWPVAR